jgi:hypothetical protein
VALRSTAPRRDHAGFPLTHVSIGSSFAVVSGHNAEETDWCGAPHAREPSPAVARASHPSASRCLSATLLLLAVLKQ